MGEKVDYTQWLKRGTSTFIPTDNAATVSTVDAGVYNLRFSDNVGFYLYKKELKLDELMLIPSKESQEAMDTIHGFWTRKEKFQEYGFVYKRGILLYGPPGSGKTSIINLICKELIEQQNGVIFILQSGSDLDRYRAYIPEIFRVIEPERPIITVIEDIDGLCENHSNETSLINILDGIEQLANVVYIATTNFTERLSDRLLNRPNRFDRRIKIGFPVPSAREFYIRHKLKEKDLAKIDIKKWVDKTKGMTMSHIGELIKSVIILDNDFDETIKMLNDLKKKPQSYDYNKDIEEEDGDSDSAAIGFMRGNGRRAVQSEPIMFDIGYEDNTEQPDDQSN